MTQEEFLDRAYVYQEHKREEIKEQTYYAWLTAMWSRQEHKFPDWDSIEKKLGAPAQQKTDLTEMTPEQALRFARVLNAAMGGKEVERNG